METHQSKMFDEDIIVNGVKATCRSCIHRERWQCGGSIIQYCGMRKSNKTQNGLLKIKVSDPACPIYKKEVES